MNNTDSAAYGALLLRLTLGVMFISHAALKILVFGLPGSVGFFESLGYPGWFAYLIVIAEIGGGLLLISGLYARWIALALLPVLIGAAQAHWGNGWVFSDQGGGWEYPVFLALACIVQGLLGNGAFALRLHVLSYPRPRRGVPA